ncbi:MAG: Nif3-like dinuclear metal center hexameric protein [Bacteroidales bacterium]|nr:Nif3-like dinuclear metal center hexameric protein [Bacteroidales bacterium]
MKINDIVSFLETIAPLSFQESYDNSGLIVGDEQQEISSVLITIDTIESVVDEAIEIGANLIVSHHPIVFTALKKITGSNYIERTIIKAIKHNIAIYACHTNLDSVFGGVNSKICEKLELQNYKILSPIQNHLQKLVTFVPVDNINSVKEAVFNEGAGCIGNYDNVSFSASGNGSFRASEKAKPFVGEVGKIHTEKELRFETIFPKNIQNKVISALIKAHPYEEVAYDIYSLQNRYSKVGMGMIGELKNEINELDFLNKIKNIFKTGSIRYTNLLSKKIKKVAVCGGSGSFLLKDAIAQKADVFVSSDFKYHQFFDADNKILIADIGHYESEQFTKDVFYSLLTKKFPNFAFYFSKINSNPINYL